MIYPIVKYPESVLLKKAQPVTEFNADLKKLADDMFESMYAAEGIGLAAPQIGISKRMYVVDLSVGKNPEERLVLINPEIIEKEGKQTEEEGCLSLPDIRDKVNRHFRVRMRAQDVDGKWFEIDGEELLSRAFQHELDHLDGILFIDRLSRLKKDLILRRIRKLIKNGEW
ncbi:peptide deformylase [Terriglobus roseus]|uniref:Peptide deformylase n=1 Tax=Terriglobus roseus TaxID=392734 RepID=A0A1G7GEZ1_9BACT|nr:peptide deformylase [Terriglobus roseus]SDE86708.1 peptide deformylase [Terriglobus roseus]